MANDKKATFPLMPIGHWWTLRTKFKQSIPGVVTDSYIATVLNMKEASARANIIPYLKQVGIIDEDRKPLERARKWRDDAQYKKVCSEIIQEAYPQDLIDACPNPQSDRDSAERWFSNHTGSGQVAVRKMISFYSILVEADPSKASEPKNNKATKKTSSSIKSPKQQISKKPENIKQPGENKRSEDNTKQSNERKSNIPSMNINLQIHISADASSDQIDKIFESMAKHIYK
ncbi:MAG: DUF5343 domain-containing protein [Thiomicrorhabdus sp.]|jgi:hypothetical protein|nr:DUF5343 domain-containing protein [Thiomicrorhabdus sp.]